MIGGGFDTVDFEEDLDARPPRSIDFLAGACFAGWRLVRPPQPNVENILIGKQRLLQFRDAKRSQLRRLVLYHFSARKVDWHGDTLSLRDFRELWCGKDPSTRNVIRKHPVFEKWKAGFAVRFLNLPLVARAEEAGRFCYGRLGGDAETLRAMNFYMEGGAEI